MTETPLLLDIEDGVARLTLNRPEAGNAIDMAMAHALAGASVRCQSDPTIRCVVVTGAGRLFCAGGDVGALAASGDHLPAFLNELASTFHMALARLARMPKPLLVLVNGPAAGAGLSLALSGDVVLGARSAHFTAAYGALGLTPDGGMSWLLPRLVGLRKAQEIILTNRRVRADEAEAIGMITRLVEDDRLAEEGRRTAKLLADSATQAIGATRALLLESYSTGLEKQFEQETRAISAAGASAECREGLAAYFEKRTANFRGV